MKNTRYFNDYQSAYNYYGGNVVPSTEIALVGDGSYVFVSSDNAVTGNQQYFDANLTNDEIVSTMTYTAYNEGFSYGESVTYPIAYEAGYSYGYDIGEIDGYDAGYAEGQAEGGANWIDVLYLDEEAKAESFLGISDWGLNAFVKYNFAKYATSSVYIDQTSALAFIAGLQNDKTMFKLIKISKDADDNAVITYNTCSINFDGTNVGAFELDSNTYNTKICVWGTLTLAVGDEVIMDCATSIDNSGTYDSFGLFGGFDDETNDPATFKCETAGTYTFGLWVDVPQVQDGTAACFVSTAFNYTGSATVPAIEIPTGEAETDYLCIQKVNADGTEITDTTQQVSVRVWRDTNTASPIVLEYSTDKVNWKKITVTSNGVWMTIMAYDETNDRNKIYIKGLNSTTLTDLHFFNTYDSNYYKISGNLHSLCFGDNYSSTTDVVIETSGLFLESKVVDASQLNVSNVICLGMFDGCSSLVNAPILSDDVIKYNQYNQMFKNCTSLTSVICLGTQVYGANIIDCFDACFENVETTGVFYKNPLTSSSFFEGPDYNDPMIDPETGDQMYDPETGEPMYNTKTVYPATWTLQDYAG